MLDVRELGRRPGAMQTVVRTVPAPEDLGVALARVPAGSEIELDLRLESVVEGVLVTGSAAVHVSAECARCLEPVSWDEDVDLQELFVYPATDARGAVVEESDEEDDPLPEVRDDLVDLQPTLRDAVVLALPLAPVCREDCAGLCPECGVRLDDHPGHQHDVADPRWAALTALLESSDDGGVADATARTTEED